MNHENGVWLYTSLHNHCKWKHKHTNNGSLSCLEKNNVLKFDVSIIKTKLMPRNGGQNLHQSKAIWLKAKNKHIHVIITKGVFSLFLLPCGSYVKRKVLTQRQRSPLCDKNKFNDRGFSSLRYFTLLEICVTSANGHNKIHHREADRSGLRCLMTSTWINFFLFIQLFSA